MISGNRTQSTVHPIWPSDTTFISYDYVQPKHKLAILTCMSMGLMKQGIHLERSLTVSWHTHNVFLIAISIYSLL